MTRSLSAPIAAQKGCHRHRIASRSCSSDSARLSTPIRNLGDAKRWWSTVLGIDPYFDQPYYVGFNVNGCELALDPNGHAESGAGPVVYWGVNDIEQAVNALSKAGTATHTPITDHGGRRR
jgi:predicted enzyme related to lactoylglutathione lyase